jgi:hypothetical protein
MYLVEHPHDLINFASADSKYTYKCSKCGIVIFKIGDIYNYLAVYKKSHAILTCEELQIKDIIE